MLPLDVAIGEADHELVPMSNIRPDNTLPRPRDIEPHNHNFIGIPGLAPILAPIVHLSQKGKKKSPSLTTSVALFFP